MGRLGSRRAQPWEGEAPAEPPFGDAAASPVARREPRPPTAGQPYAPAKPTMSDSRRAGLKDTILALEILDDIGKLMALTVTDH
jgi:hypothetical protein